MTSAEGREEPRRFLIAAVEADYPLVAGHGPATLSPDAIGQHIKEDPPGPHTRA
ncbi:hypothetical protein ACIG5E_38275 [Kitasatospora sp. NPDC053057]|uniref:hypothetical protein n=1 Tax=Kitasatospora sp. NPDC053057 TaxID=3364062 RepID=UPI0037C6D3F7